MPAYRTGRINGEMKRELAEIIRLLKDPRIPELTSVMDVEVTKDLKYAKVYVSVFEADEEKQKDAIRGLKSSAGFIRQELKKRIALRQIPELSFVLDHSIEYGAHINDVIRSIESEHPLAEKQKEDEDL